MCNSPGEATGRIFLDLNEIDIEHYLTNNPAILAEIVNRNQNILPQQPVNRETGQQYVIDFLFVNIDEMASKTAIICTHIKHY